jgi:hypothetical protein
VRAFGLSKTDLKGLRMVKDNATGRGKVRRDRLHVWLLLDDVQETAERLFGAQWRERADFARAEWIGIGASSECRFVARLWFVIEPLGLGICMVLQWLPWSVWHSRLHCTGRLLKRGVIPHGVGAFWRTRCMRIYSI